MHVQCATLRMGCHPGTTDSSYPIIMHPKQAPGIPKDQIQTSKMTTKISPTIQRLFWNSLLVLSPICQFSCYLQSGTLTLKRPTEAFMLHQRLKAMASIDGSLSDSVELWFSRRSAHLSSKERNQVSPLMNLQLHQLLPKTVWSFSPEKKWQRYHWWDAIVILWLGWTLGGFLCAHTSPCRSAYICACFCDTIRWYASAKHTYLIFFCGWRGVQLTKHLQKIPQMSTNSCVFLGTDIDIICKKISPTFPGPVWEPWAKTKCLGAPHGVNNSSFRLATARWKTMRDF